MFDFMITSLIDPAVTNAWWDSHAPAILPSVVAGLWMLCGLVRFYKHYVDTGVWFVDPDNPLAFSSNPLATTIQSFMIWVFLLFLQGLAIILLYPIIPVVILTIVGLSVLFYYTATHAHRRELLVKSLRGDD